MAMIVPIELQILAQKRGHLSPELTLGWRIGEYVSTVFGCLSDLRIASTKYNDTSIALSIMSRIGQTNTPIHITAEERPWDYIFYHPLFGTVFQFSIVWQSLSLPPEMKILEDDLDKTNPIIFGAYMSELERIAQKILYEPVTNYCNVSEIRLRPLRGDFSDNQNSLRCRRCGETKMFRDMWDVEGVICCVNCCGIEPLWFQNNVH